MKKIIFFALAITLVLLGRLILFQPYISFDIKSSKQENLQIFFLTDNQSQYTEQNSYYTKYASTSFSSIKAQLPFNVDISKIRIDLGAQSATFYMKDFYIQKSLFKKVELTNEGFIKVFGVQQNQIENIELVKGIVKIRTSGNDGYLVSNPEEFNNVAKSGIALDYQFFFIMIAFFLGIVLIVMKKAFHITPFNKMVVSILFFIVICILAFYQSGISYLLLKFFFVFAFQASFMFILFRYDMCKNILPVVSIVILIVFANLPLITQGFLFKDDLFFFMWSQLSYAIGSRRPLFFIISDYGMLLNHDNFYLFRLLNLSFFILFAVSFYLFLQNIFTRTVAFVIILFLTCSVVAVDLIGYATTFPVIQSLFLSLASFVMFDYAVKSSNSLYKISLFMSSFIVLLAAFCFYQITTPIVFTFIAVNIIQRSLSLRHTIYYLILYGITAIIYLPFTRIIMKFYNIPFAQVARGEFISSIQDVVSKIVFFATQVFPQAILKVVSIFTGNSIYRNDSLFDINIIDGELDKLCVLFFITAVSVLGVIFFYKKNKSFFSLLVLLALIPMSYYPFLLLKENGLMAYYLIPLVYLLIIYFTLIIAGVAQKIRISGEKKRIFAMVLLSVVIIQANYYAGKVWVTKNVLWYNNLRDDVCNREELTNTRGGGKKGIQVYGIISASMPEPYVNLAMTRILADCGYNPEDYDIRTATNSYSVSYLTIGEYKRLNAQLSPDEQEWLKGRYIFYPGFGSHHLINGNFTDDEKNMLSKAFKEAGIIFDNATVINILPSYYK